MGGSSIREHSVLYRKQIRITGVIALVLGLSFIVAGVWGIQVILGDSWLNYLAGGVLLVLAYFMLH